MTRPKHRRILSEIFDELVAFDPGCSLLLGGSMAHGDEREGSDIDLGVFLSEEPDPGRYTDLVNAENRSKWHVCAEREGIKIDTGWWLVEELADDLPNDKELVCYPYILWEIVRDPSGRLGRYIAAMRRWLERNPWLAEIWGKQYEDMRRHKVDPTHPLEYTEKEWYAHLRKLVDER